MTSFLARAVPGGLRWPWRLSSFRRLNGFLHGGHSGQHPPPALVDDVLTAERSGFFGNRFLRLALGAHKNGLCPRGHFRPA